MPEHMEKRSFSPIPNRVAILDVVRDVMSFHANVATITNLIGLERGVPWIEVGERQVATHHALR